MIKGFITNLGKYNEGELIGKWITFPIDEEEKEEIFKEIGINEEYEEYFFTDWENVASFNFGEYVSITEINEIAEKLESVNEDEEIIEAIFEYCSDTDEAIEVLEAQNYIIYNDCDDMEDVAIQYAEETGLLYNIPENIKRYFDFEALGRDMELESTFINFGNGYIELI